MSDRAFRAYLPTKPKSGDEILLRAKLKDDAARFSVNFCLSRPEGISECHSPPHIAYHFRTDFFDNEESVTIHNWKNGGFWQAEIEEPNNWISDRSAVFCLIFRFHEEYIKVFAEDTQHTPDYEFEHQYPMEAIKMIELWDDFEYVEELTFKYNRS